MAVAAVHGYRSPPAQGVLSQNKGRTSFATFYPKILITGTEVKFATKVTVISND